MFTLDKETKTTLIYIFIAYTFSVLMRMIWIYQFNGYEPFMFNGQFMINTNDGYYYAEGARDILSGIHQENDRSPVNDATSLLTMFFAKVLPFSFESTILYLPVFLSSLIVIPIVLIAKGLKNLEMGLIAALLASIVWSYYNRTMVGYFDTDMLNIVLPLFLLWSIIWAIDTNEDKYLLITALDILVYRWWYPQSYSLEFSFFGLILAYTLLFDRKNFYNYKLLAIMMFAMMDINVEIRLPIVLAIFYLFKETKFDKFLFYILGVSVVGFFVSGGFDPIWNRLSIYVFKDSVSVGEKGLQLHFFTVMQTIREAGHISFETFANRISGHIVTFVIAIVGYLYLIYRHKIMIFTLPMVGLGFFASVGGLRFTIYAVPILAFGVAFLITEISSKIQIKKLKYFVMAMFTVTVLYPNYKHIQSYKVPTVFNKDEVKVLNDLQSKTDREDYVISWWDYGYPIRYYADVKTLGDGGKHSGSVNFPLSFMLTHSQKEAAQMARLDVEYTEKTFHFAKEHKEEIEDKNLTIFSNIEQMTIDYGYKNTNDFLETLKTDIKLPKKTRDIYFYLPFKMLDILPTINLFSNIDLMTGAQKKSPFIFKSNNFKDNGKVIYFGSNISLNKQDMTIDISKTRVKLRRFVDISYDKNMVNNVKIQSIDLNGPLSLIYLRSYKTFLVLDEKTYNSMYIQLMLLEDYNHELYEKVTGNPYAKIYKIKI